jgi:hypothetical protein
MEETENFTNSPKPLRTRSEAQSGSIQGLKKQKNATGKNINAALKAFRISE